MKSPEISVIIPALNEEKYISHSMQGLKRQTFKDFETIVVDGGSEDRTASLARRYAEVIVEYGKGAGRGRNIGARAAKGKILVFLDADSKPSPNLLLNYHKIFQNRGVVAATGPIRPLEKTSPKIRVGYVLVAVYFVKLSLLFGNPSIIGSNFAVRADKFRLARGFNEKFLTYEDWDLSKRLKKYGEIVYSNDAVVNTSVRRVAAWGLSGYFIYYFINMLMYHFLKRSRTNYKHIR